MNKIIFSIAFSSLLLTLFTILLILKYLGQASYSFLILVSIFVGFVVYFKDEIGELDLKKMKLIFQKTQKVKQEINHVALSLAKIIANLSTYSSGSWLNRKTLNDEIENLLTKLDIELNEKKQILELPRIVEKGMKDNASLTPEEKQKVDDMFKLE